MVTVLTSKTVRSKFVSIVGTVDGARLHANSKNLDITDTEAKALLEAKAPIPRGE